MSNRYTVAKSFSLVEDLTNSKYVLSSLMDMMDQLRSKIYPSLMREGNMKWLMARDTFTWLVHACEKEYGFSWQIELNCTEPNRYTIMDIEVAFVNSEAFRRNDLVELTYGESDADTVKWNHDSDIWNCVNAGLGRIDIPTWACQSLINANNIEIRKEKVMKSFYVGCGKKVTIENVIFNNPATIVFWSDGTKTVVKRQKGDKKFDPEKGLAMAICKKIMGNKGNFNEEFKRWLPKE